MVLLGNDLANMYWPTQVVLHFGIQLSMLRQITMVDLDLMKVDLELHPFQIQTSMNESKKVCGMTHQTFYVILQPYHPTDGSSAMKIKLLVTNAMSYDVLMGGVVLYPIGFTLYFWKHTTSYML
jgi:hypothetical protein